MNRTFIYTRTVQDELAALRISDADQRTAEHDILAGRGVTIPRTAGLKELRIGRAGSGKRGGARLVYADFPQSGTTILLAILSKNDREDFSPEELLPRAWFIEHDIKRLCRRLRRRGDRDVHYTLLPLVKHLKPDRSGV
jgi:hypothetical protein